MAGEIHSKREKLLVVMRADAAGMTSNAEMSKVPITRMVTKMVSDSSDNSTISTTEKLTPDTWATSGSNVENNSLRYHTTTTASANSATAPTAKMSDVFTPSTLPNNTASMLFDA